MPRANPQMEGPQSRIDMEPGQLRSDCPIGRQQHYRLVEEEVGMPLYQFQDGRQLVSLIYDCLLGESYMTTRK